MAEIAPVKALSKAQFFTLGMPGGIQHALIIEARRIHHQCIALPFAHRVSEPRRLRVFRKCPPIRVDLPVWILVFVEHDNDSRRLHDLKRKIIIQVALRNAMWHTPRRGTLSVTTLPELCGCSRAHDLFSRLEVRQYIQKVLGEGAWIVPGHNEIFENIAEYALIFAWRCILGLPDSGKIGLAIRRPRRLGGQVRFTVARPWRAA